MLPHLNNGYSFRYERNIGEPVPVGHKDDTDKDRWDLLPLGPIRWVVRVLMFGSRRYGDWDWVELEKPKERYYSACMRHLSAWYEGEKTDKDSGLPHLAHAICNLVFMLALEHESREVREVDA